MGGTLSRHDGFFTNTFQGNYNLELHDVNLELLSIPNKLWKRMKNFLHTSLGEIDGLLRNLASDKAPGSI